MSRPRRSFGNQPGQLVATMLRALAAEVSDPGRYSRAKAYARDGAVIEIDIRPEVVSGLVLGSRREPYEVLLTVDPAPADEIERAHPAQLGSMTMLDSRTRRARRVVHLSRCRRARRASCANTPSPCSSCLPTRRASSRPCSSGGVPPTPIGGQGRLACQQATATRTCHRWSRRQSRPVGRDVRLHQYRYRTSRPSSAVQAAATTGRHPRRSDRPTGARPVRRRRRHDDASAPIVAPGGRHRRVTVPSRGRPRDVRAATRWSTPHSCTPPPCR